MFQYQKNYLALNWHQFQHYYSMKVKDNKKKTVINFFPLFFHIFQSVQRKLTIRRHSCYFSPGFPDIRTKVVALLFQLIFMPAFQTLSNRCKGPNKQTESHSNGGTASRKAFVRFLMLDQIISGGCFRSTA